MSHKRTLTQEEFLALRVTTSTNTVGRVYVSVHIGENEYGCSQEGPVTVKDIQSLIEALGYLLLKPPEPPSFT